MSKIANWVFGSFFRTIGRLLVFILLGVIIAHFIDFGSLKDNFSITDLFFDKVKADTFVGINMGNFTNWNNTSSYIGSGQYAEIQLNTGQLYNERNNFTVTNGVYGENIQYIVLNGYITDINYIKDQFECDYIGQQGCETWSLNNSTSLEFKLWARGWASPCTIEFEDPNLSAVETLYWTATCPYPNNSVSQFYYRFKYSQLNQTGTIRLGVNKTAYLIKDTSLATTDAINQQTQQQQQQHQETMNSTTTEAESEATSFFGDFEDQDFGGLSGIVTAPLNTIRSLLSSTCTNLVLPLPFVNENLTLPCMTSIYNEHFGAFFTLYQTIILSIVAYRCIRSIFYDVHGFTNPDDDRIEVMDL